MFDSDTRTLVVVGAQWGDEGKGKLVDVLAERADWVVVPSIWWENSPLVIQEAFMHGRPVICSDIGGMAEKVSDGVDGIHFRANDVQRLAEAIKAAATTPGLWEKLRDGIRPIYPMPEHVNRLTVMYEKLVLEGAA